MVATSSSIDVGEQAVDKAQDDNDIDIQKSRYFDVYGPEARAEIIFPQAEKETKITTEDIQGLVRWVLADGTMPNWVFIKNKPLISKLIFAYIPGLDAATYMFHSKYLQSLTRLCGKPRALLAPRFIIDSNQFLDAFFSVKCKKRKLTGDGKYHTVQMTPPSNMPQEINQQTFYSREADGLINLGLSEKFPKRNEFHTGGLEREIKKQFPPSYYTLTEAEMQEHRFPLSVDSDDYIETQPADRGSFYHHMVGLDCEMCYTKDGLELTRVSLVDEKGQVLLDSLVRPLNPITDYNTRFSGITHEMMANVTTTIEDIQMEILKIVSADTILVGHSLENDLRSLKLVHRRVIDTALLYRHPRGLLFRPALRILALQFLKRKIQHGNGGHNSIEDARAAMELALLKIRKGPGFGNSSASLKENLLSVLSNHGNPCSVIDRRVMLQRYAVGPTHSLPCTTDDEALLKVKKEVRNKQRRFVWVQFSDLQQYHEENARNLDSLADAARLTALSTCNRVVDKEIVKRSSTTELKQKLKVLDERVEELHNALDSQSMLVVVSGHGDIAMVRRLRQLTKDKLLDKEASTQKTWASVLGEIQAEAETAVAFVCVKD
ncbi:hypothetical protein KP509_24G066800 [Ceratopteris richardii]|uniref:Exonuclease domain-containing protein n=1 Tax=Ceratopteris richardii TaxID=49495 RepID=A0A8T2RW23_CERRI|nr:hypothetical protein KP509_24G066800 [Ceratopteris richardii]